MQITRGYQITLFGVQKVVRGFGKLLRRPQIEALL